MKNQSKNEKNSDFPLHDFECQGTATVGERGQVVIPADARQELEIEASDQLIVFTTPIDSVVFVPADKLEKLISSWSKKIGELKQASDQAEKDNT